MFITKKHLSSFLLLALYGADHRVLASPSSGARTISPVTFERITTRVEGRLPLFKSDSAAMKVRQDLEAFNSFNLFQKAEAQRYIFTCFWQDSFQNLADPVNAADRLNKSLALDSGLAALNFYKDALNENDNRAVLPLLEMIHTSTFVQHPEIAPQIRVHEAFQSDFLIQKAVNTQSFEEVLRAFNLGQNKLLQTSLIRIFQMKTQHSMPSAQILFDFFQKITICMMEEPPVQISQTQLSNNTTITSGNLWLPEGQTTTRAPLSQNNNSNASELQAEIQKQRTAALRKRANDLIGQFFD